MKREQHSLDMRTSLDTWSTQSHATYTTATAVSIARVRMLREIFSAGGQLLENWGLGDLQIQDFGRVRSSPHKLAI